MLRVRAISGFERPAIQWLFAAIGVLLIAACVAGGVTVVRLRRAADEARRDALQARTDRDQIEAALARERSTREAFALQLGKERNAAPAAPPTLTLEPVKVKSPRGPEVAVRQTSAATVELRLLLPAGAPPGPYTLTARSWTTGAIAWVRAGLRAAHVDAKPAIVVPITSDVLEPGPYELVLAAGTPPQDLTTYEVSVVPAALVSR